MILPFFHGIPTFRALITWCLFFTNVVFYFSYSKLQINFEKSLNKIYSDNFFVQSQGNLFAQIIDSHPQESSELLNSISYKAKIGNTDSQMTLGQLAFRSSFFKKFALTQEFKGDIIQYNYWKLNYDKMMREQKEDPSYIMGLTKSNSSILSMISYQFAHGGVLHLLTNMWFLLIFGSFIERLWGSLYFLGIYLFSGIMAAIVFIFLSGASESPLIGASGAISGLMGLVLVLFWNKKINCFYWVLPKIGYHGFKKFPAWIVLAVWISSDLAGYLGTMEEFGGVAHAAHIGGFGFGALLGLTLRFIQSERNLFASYSQ
jgi:membrane associated rhomboid family serine protease